MPEGHHVFLCHSSGDKALARDLYWQLRGDGIDCWFDEEDLLPGQDWDYEIGKALRGSRYVLVCLSRASIGKAGYVQKELRKALEVADEQPEGAMFIIPARLEECEIPERLRRWHWVDLFEKDAYVQLLRTLARGASDESSANRVEGLPAPTTRRGRRVCILEPSFNAFFFTRGLEDRIQSRLGADRLVKYESAKPNATIAASHVILVGNDETWKAAWTRREGDPDEQGLAENVRSGLLTSLKLGVRVVPLIVQGTWMPAESELPPELQWYASIRPYRLPKGAIHHDLSGLFRFAGLE